MYNILQLYEPTNISEAYHILDHHHSAVIIAGGTDLLVGMHQGRIKEAVFVSIRNIKELNGINMLPDGGISIGSLVTFGQLAKDHYIRQYLPILKTAALAMGGPQIRNVATIGGNICNGATSADSAPALFALEAKLVIENSTGARTVDIEDFYLGPSQVDINRNEILTSIVLPPVEKVNWGGHYTKFSKRKAMDISTIGCAAVCKINGIQELTKVRIALGTAAPTPIRCKNAEELALNKKLTGELLEQIGTAAVETANPRSSWRASREFRQQLIKELTARTLVQAFHNAGGDFSDENH